MSRRVVLGALPGGGFGLRVSLPGVDVMTGNSNDPTLYSFSSDWADIAKIHQVGLATIPFNNGNTAVPFPDLGYRPFVEARKIAGSLVYDDWFFPGRSGIGVQIQTNQLLAPGVFAAAGTYAMLYMVFRIPVPTQ